MKVRAMPFWLFMISGKGSRRERGWGGGWGGSPPLFEKKKGIFDGKRIFDWRTSPKYPNLWLVRFDPISQGEHKREWGTLFSLGKPQNDFLYKTALSRRLLRFHQPGDVVYAQRMESFLSRFSNLHGATISSLLKQTVLCIHVVENMKKFQELLQQSMINAKLFLDLQASAGKSYNLRSRNRSFSAARRLKTRRCSPITEERF